jgi:hypothetical protein
MIPVPSLNSLTGLREIAVTVTWFHKKIKIPGKLLL